MKVIFYFNIIIKVTLNGAEKSPNENHPKINNKLYISFN